MKKVFNLLFFGALMAAITTACTPNPPEPDNNGNKQDTTVVTPPIPVQFDLAVTDITSTSASVTVTPNDNNTLYYYDVLAAEIFTQYSDAEIAELLLEEMKTDYEEYKDEYKEDYGVNNFAEAYLSKGTDNWDFSGLNANTDYYAYAFAIDTATMTVNGELAKELFTTLEVIPSDNKISFSQDADDPTLITITTTNDDPYIWTYLSQDELTEYYEGDAQLAWSDFVELLKGYGLLDWVLSYGDESISTTETFDEAGEYVFVAAGYDGGQTTEIVTYTLTVTEDMIDTSEDESYAAPHKLNAKKQKHTELTTALTKHIGK